MLPTIAVRHIPSMSEKSIEKVRMLEDKMLQMQQTPVCTFHLIHAGVYTRTVMLPAGCMLTGVLIKIATTLIVSGDATVYIGDATLELRGFNVLPASADRKQAIIARSDVHMVMLFACSESDVEAAEKQFTDEFDQLASHLDSASNRTVITGD